MRCRLFCFGPGADRERTYELRRGDDWLPNHHMKKKSYRLPMPRRSARAGENSPCGQKESCMLKRIVPLVLALVLCAGLAQAKTKAPATQLPGDLTLAEAQKVLDAALVKAKAQGVPMNIAIVDAGGNLKAFVRQDGAFIGSIDVSTKKAVTARYFNMPTSTLGAASQPGQELFGIEATNGGLVIFGGGELLIRDNVIVGAIGVSGGSVAEDTNVAKAGAAALK